MTLINTQPQVIAEFVELPPADPRDLCPEKQIELLESIRAIFTMGNKVMLQTYHEHSHGIIRPAASINLNGKETYLPSIPLPEFRRTRR